MVSRMINTLEGTNHAGFLNLGSRLRIRDFVNACKAIMETESIPDKFIVLIERSLYNCIHSYIKKYSLITSDFTRAEFREASKKHQRNLNSILTHIIQSITTDRYDTHIYLNNNNITVKVNSLKVMDEDITPRSFRSWYDALYIITYFGRGITVDNIIVICRILTSVYNIVNEPELFDSEKNLMVRELIDTISGKCKYSSIDDFKSQNTNPNPQIHEGIEDLKETVKLLNYYCTNTRIEPPKWASDFVRALRSLHRNQRMFYYDNNNSMLSSNSTCSSMVHRGKRITIPGLFASCIEKDYFKENFPDSNFDAITGFNLEYCINDDLPELIKAKSQRRYSVAIKQKKPKPRIIHPLNNSEQDRLIYFHNLIAYVLARVESDCTFDQSKGPKHIKYVMDKEDRWSLYSLDLTSATDTFSLGLQWMIIKDLILANHDHSAELAEQWLAIMLSESNIKINGDLINFRFSNGQPQGFLSSFPSFACEHHIVMLTTLRKSGLDLSPEQFYRVLGDDGLITCYDPSGVIPQKYQLLMNSANVECNITSKGYLYNPNIPEMSVKIAEFAKYLILDGIEVTPIPTRLLVTEEKFNNYIGLAAWYSDHRQSQWKIEELKFFLSKLNSMDSDHYSTIIDVMVHLNIPGIFGQSFQKKFDRLMKGHSKLDIAIAQAILVESLIFSACSRLLGSKNLPDNKETLIHLSKELRVFTDFIDDKSIISERNKLSILKDEVYTTYRTFSEVCRKYSSLDDLSDDDILIICMILQTNNSNIIKDQVNNVLEGINLLTINPNDIQERDHDSYMNRILELFKSFNISIERSWSSYSRRVPVDYLNNSKDIVNDVIKKITSQSIIEYVEENEFSIVGTPVESDQQGDIEPDDTEMYHSGFESYQLEDWELVL
jgi:hypothetical protein